MRFCHALTVGLPLFWGHVLAGAAGYQHFSQGPISLSAPAPYVLSRSSGETECFVMVHPLAFGHLPLGTICLYPGLQPEEIQQLGFVERSPSGQGDRNEDRRVLSYARAGQFYPARRIRTPLGPGMVAKGVPCELDSEGVDAEAAGAPFQCHVALIQTLRGEWAVAVDVLAAGPEGKRVPDEVFDKIIQSLTLHRGAMDKRPTLRR